MDNSPEARRLRSGKLAQAIEEYCADMELPDMLGDWLLIGTRVRIDADGDPNCEYFVALSGGTMLQHHALGLSAKLQEMLDDDSLEE